MAIPYANEQRARPMNTRIFFPLAFLTNQHQRNTITENKQIWIHLSSQILSNQFFCGNTDPGKHNNTVVIKNQAEARRRGSVFFLKTEFDTII